AATRLLPLPMPPIKPMTGFSKSASQLFRSCKPAIQFGPRNWLLLAAFFHQLPELVGLATFHLLHVHSRDTDHENKWLAVLGNDQPFFLCLLNTLLPIDFRDVNCFHRISSVVLWGGFRRIAWTITSSPFVSTS